MIWLLSLALAASPADEFNDAQYAQYLGLIQPTFERDLQVSGRAPLQLVRTAIAIDQLGDETWLPKLCGGSAEAATVLRLYLRLLRGELVLLPTLFDTVGGSGSPFWNEAEVVAEVARKLPEPARYRAAATALRLAGCFFLGVSREHVTQLLTELFALPADQRDELVKAWRAMQEGLQPPRSERALGRGLLVGVYEGKLTDPAAVDLAYQLLPTLEARLDYLRDVARQQRREGALQLNRLLLSAAPTDADVVRTAAIVYRTFELPDDALKLYQRAEQEVAYPGRRAIRLDFLQWIGREGPAPKGSRRTVKYPQLPMLQDVARTWQQRLQADENDVAARLALGDAYFVTRAPPAKLMYQRVMLAEPPPELLWTAWVALAEADPAAAYEQIDRLPSREGYTEVLALTALAAGELEDGAARLAEQPAGMIWSLLLSALAGDTLRAPAAASAVTAEQSVEAAIRALLELVQGKLPKSERATSPWLRGAAEQALAKTTDRSGAWALACNLASEALPQARLETAADWWQRLVLGLPGDAELVPLLRLGTALTRQLTEGEPTTPVEPLLSAAAKVVRLGQWPGRLQLVESVAATCRRTMRRRRFNNEKVWQAWQELIARLSEQDAADIVARLQALGAG